MANPASRRSRFYQPVVQSSTKSTPASRQERKNPKNEPEILAACRTGNLGWVKELLKNNPDYVNQTFRAGKAGDMVPPLYLAAQEGHKEVVTLLLKVNADPNWQCKDGTTALYMASQNEYKGVVGLLLDNQANPNIQCNDGSTALCIASQEGVVEVVELLLKAEADPDIQPKGGTTALFMASKNGHEDVVKLLLGASANPDNQYNNGVTPLFMAVRNGHYGIFKLLKNAKANPLLRWKFPFSVLGRLPSEAASLKYRENPPNKDTYQLMYNELKEMEKEWTKKIKVAKSTGKRDTRQVNETTPLL